MIGDRLTRNLETILNSENIKTNEKEMQTMAKLTGRTNKDTKPEDKGITRDEEKIAESASTVDEIMANAAKELEDKVEEDKLNKTSNYVGGEGNENKEDEDTVGEDGKPLTPKQKEEARIKKAKAEERRLNAIAHNQFIESNKAEISSTLGDTDISDQHSALQIACREYGRHEGFLMSEGERPALRVSRSFQRDKESKLFKYKGNLAPDVKEELESNKLRKSLNKGDLVEYEMSLKYTMSGPKNQFGSIVSVPEVLNVSVLDLKSGNFEAPNKQEIKESNMLTFSLSAESFFTYLTLYFGGEIRENDAVLETKAKMKSNQNWLEGNVTIVSVTDNITKKQIRSIRKRITSKCRTSIYIPENIIPYKIYETEAIDRMDPETVMGHTSAITRSLSAGKEKEAKYEYLDEAGKKIMQAKLSPDKSVIEAIDIKLFDGSMIPGIGDAKDLKLMHWSDHVRNDSGGYDKVEAPAVLPKMYENESSTGNITYKPVVRILGMDLQLPDMEALGYPAAGRVAKLGITENNIALLMEDHKKDIKAKREARKLNDPNRGNDAKSVSRVSGGLGSKVATNLFFQNLMGGVETEGLEIDVDTVKQELMTVALRAQ